jgi:NAD(P)H dehydrogenase (quinone)
VPSKAAGFLARGVEVRQCDYDDPAVLPAALDGIDTLLLVSGPDLSPGVRARQHRAVIDAAAAGWVSQLVYTSAVGAESGLGHLEDHRLTERALNECGVEHTILRNGIYSEAFFGAALADATSTGAVRSSTNGRHLNTASVRDLALCASAVLTGAGQDKWIHTLVGRLWTYPELAEAIGEALGRPVRYRPVQDREAGWVGAMGPMIRAGALATTTLDIEGLLGRRPEAPGATIHRMLELGWTAG